MRPPSTSLRRTPRSLYSRRRPSAQSYASIIITQSAEQTLAGLDFIRGEHSPSRALWAYMSEFQLHTSRAALPQEKQWNTRRLSHRSGVLPLPPTSLEDQAEPRNTRPETQKETDDIDY